jgi:hypothetical protein
VKPARFESSAPLAIGGLTRAEPIRARTMEADAGVLAAQVLFSMGLALALILTPFLFPCSTQEQWGGWRYDPTLLTIKLALIVVLLLGNALWWHLMLDSRQFLLKRETMHAAPEAAPPGEPATCRIEVDLRSFNGHLRKAWLAVPVPAESFATFARAALNGQPVAVSRWTGQGKPFSRSEFETMRDWLMEMALAEWLDTRHREQGWRFTLAGCHVLDRWLNWYASVHVHGQVTENEAVHGPEGE